MTLLAWPGARIALAALLSIHAAHVNADSSGVPALCSAGERTLFSCPTANGKLIAVCAAGKDQAQYRFGKPNKLELVFPPEPKQGPDRLLWSHYSRPGVDRLSVRFVHDNMEYTVFDWIDESGRRDSGVRMSTLPPGKRTRISCLGRPLVRPVEIAAHLNCDKDSALANCR